MHRHDHLPSTIRIRETLRRAEGPDHVVIDEPIVQVVLGPVEDERSVALGEHQQQHRGGTLPAGQLGEVARAVVDDQCHRHSVVGSQRVDGAQPLGIAGEPADD